MTKRTGMTHSADFKAEVVLAAFNREKTRVKLANIFSLQDRRRHLRQSGQRQQPLCVHA